MSFHVVNRDQGFFEFFGQVFGTSDADFQGRRQTRTDGDGDGIRFAYEETPRSCFSHHKLNFGLVGAFGQVGDDPAVFPVDIDLRGDDIRQNSPAPDNRGRGLVAGSVDG